MADVLFAYRSPELPKGGNLSGRVEIFDMLREHDLNPLVSLGVKTTFTADGGVEVHNLISETSTEYAGRTALSGIGLIVNRWDRSIKKEDLPDGTILPPVINASATRSLAFRKNRMHSEVLEPLGVYIPTVFPQMLADIETFLEEQTAENFIVKPNSGTNGIGLQKIERTDVATLFNADPSLFGTQILQPAYDFTAPFEAGIKPYDAASAEELEGWNKAGKTKEVRVYGFHSPEVTTVFPVGRALDSDGDHWLFVDPESVPAYLLEHTAQAMRKVSEVSGAAAVLGTVDYGYGRLADEPLGWVPIEVNAKSPYLIGYDKHPGVAKDLRVLLTRQIAETVAATHVTGMVH